MADNDRKVVTSDDRPTVSANKSEASHSKTVHVEQLARLWVEQSSDGVLIRHKQGDVYDVPEKLFDELGDESGHFKPAFRRVAST